MREKKSIHIFGDGAASAILCKQLSLQPWFIPDFVQEVNLYDVLHKDHISPYVVYLHEPVLPDLGAENTPINVLYQAWFQGAVHATPTIPMNNCYSRKVRLGMLGETSIMEVSPSYRKGWLIPDDWKEQYYTQSASRSRVPFRRHNLSAKFLKSEFLRLARKETQDAVITTLPLNITSGWLEKAGRIARFTLSAQMVNLREIDNHFFTLTLPPVTVGCKVYQYLYVADDSKVSRIFLTGSKGFTIECGGTMEEAEKEIRTWCRRNLWRAFGLDQERFKKSLFDLLYRGASPRVQFLTTDQRKAVMRYLTDRLGFFSLGRWATWSYKRLDHLWDDAGKVAQFIRYKVAYLA